MSEIQDCATIIAADMRQLADDIAAGRAIVGQSVWRSYADRVEKIGTGNVAKLREALQQAKVAILAARKKMGVDNPIILEIIDAALAAPPRNCEVGTAEEQAERFKFAKCDKLPKCRPWGECCLTCFAKWAQMPYEEGGAK